MAASYASYRPEAPAAAAERKSTDYSGLSSSNMFFPVAVRLLVDENRCFVQRIDRRIIFCRADPWSSLLLYRRISLAEQRYNSKSCNTFKEV